MKKVEKADVNETRIAADILDEAANTYRERNELYGNSYRQFGLAMCGLFPAGIKLATIDDFNRFGILVQIVGKLCRYSNNFAEGGHIDSAHDAAVYSAMLQELTEVAKNDNL